MPGHVQLFIHQHPQVLLSRPALNPSGPQHVFIPGAVFTQVQDPAFGRVEPHGLRTGSLLQPVQVPLDGMPSLSYVDRTTQLGVFCKLAGVYLIP